MKPVRTRLKEYKKLASGSEKNLIEYIQNHMSEVVKMSVHELAKEAYTSASTVIRLVKKMGFKGFKEFKQDLVAELTLKETRKIPEQNELTKEDKVKDIIGKITYRHMISIEETNSLIDLEVFEKCITLLAQAEQVYIFGIGASYLAAKDLQQKMMRVGKLSLAFEDYHLQILQARHMKSKDVAIVFSYSGQTEEMVRCCEQIKEVGATLISVTRFGQSKIAALADYNLYIASNEPLIRSGAMTSRLVQLYIVDMIYLSYIHYSYEQASETIQKTQLEKEERS